jgi:phospholipid/cholesterol/gamma-HCH transport system substrate-binding protein
MKRKKKRMREIRVGAVILLALAIVVIAVFFIGGQSTLFGEKVKYRILFTSTGGLYEGDPVLLTGVEVGNVTRMGFPKEIHEKKILVEVSVLKSVSQRIRQDTRARIGSASLVYGKVVELSMGSPEEPVIPPGGRIPAEEGTDYKAIVDTTQQVVEGMRRLLTKIDDGKGALGMLINEPMELQETLHHLAVSSQRLSEVLARVDDGEGALGMLLSDTVTVRQTLVNMESAMGDLAEAARRVKGQGGLLGRLINDEEYGRNVSEDLRSAIHSLASITAKIDTGSGALGSLINDPELYMGLQNVVLGMERSSIAKWLIQNRRKAGEKTREELEGREEPEG